MGNNMLADGMQSIQVTVLSFLIPVAVLGLIAWIVVGFVRSRGAEPFTLATATALYSRVLFIAGILMALSGAGVILKALFAFINLSYSYIDYSGYQKQLANGAYPVPPGPPSGYLEQQRGQDLVLGITLVVIGVLVAVAHFYLARAVSRMPGGSPSWITRGTVLALAVTTAVGAIPSAALGLYGMLSYFIVGTSQNAVYTNGPPQPWGDPLGTAIAFVPAWIYVMTRLVKDLQAPRPAAPA
jgi:hypothetical protein